MRIINNTFFMLVLALVSLHANATDCFKMKAGKGDATRIDIMETIKNNTVLSPFLRSESIGGLSVSGVVEKENEDYFVRIILKDKDGKEHLIMELYDEINEALSFSFSDYCEETALFADAVTPDSIKVIVRNATITLNAISYIPVTASSYEKERNLRTEEYEAIRKEQLKNTVNRINNYNRNHRKLWRAGVTNISQKAYEVKKRVMEFTDDDSTGGMEYYIGGIFEIGSKLDRYKMSRTKNVRDFSPLFVDKFDWRNRHGKNWMTSVKDQEGSGYCVAFATVGCVEAIANLYYNRLLDLDLSEQEIASCHEHADTIDPYRDGVYVVKAAEYVRDNGVCNELSYPFVNSPNQTCHSGLITPDTIVSIEGFHEYNVYSLMSSGYEDSLKMALINKGPLSSGMIYRKLGGGISGHEMALTGYGTIHAGDTIKIETNWEPITWNEIIIGENDVRIGKTYWIYKNSWGSTYDHNGYMYLMHDGPSLLTSSYSYNYPISIKSNNGVDIFNESDIVCEDADGDGYYFWGLGPKPAHCPSWAPDTPDGDDSDINSGPMNEYGFLETLPAGITIKTPVEYYQSNNWIMHHLGIVNGGVLTISGNSTMISTGKIRVCEGGVLIIDGGNLYDANIELIPGSTLIIRNGGTIYMDNGKQLSAPLGATVEIEEGSIY